MHREVLASTGSDQLGGSVAGLIDELQAYYLDWLHESAAVRREYRRWSEAPLVDAPGRYSAYLAALDREESAALTYAQVLAEVERALGCAQAGVA
jgi:hypothetical protein